MCRQFPIILVTFVLCFSSTANDSCYGSPCQNNGTCVHGEFKHTCICMAGYAGDNCEININECASAPCQNQGNCTDLINSFTCTCPPGFTGPLCEINIDECASQPCQFGGTCIDGANSVSFLFSPSFSRGDKTTHKTNSYFTETETQKWT